jgi:RNA 3'-terminal phosphate cyclase-like protein
VTRRGLPPKGGGQAEVTVPIVRELRPLNLVDPGLIKRIRGVAYCCKV